MLNRIDVLAGTRMLLLALLCVFSVDIAAQCETFGMFDIGDDVEVSCVDSCITLTSPSIANVAVGGSDYEVEDIDYVLPYPFSQGAAAITTGDDVYSGIIPLGFSFNFYGQNYAQCRMSSNGWISFSTGETAGYNPSATNPSPNLPINSIMAVYSDLNPSVCGNVRYSTQGVAPCRKFVASWNSICQFGCTSQHVSAEIVLYEGTNVIEIYLGNRPSCYWGDAVVGIQNSSGTNGVSPAGFNTGNWNASNKAWRFASSEVVEGTTLWYEGDTFLGIGDTLDFCTSQTTQVTGWFSQLPANTFCEEFDINVTSAGSYTANNQIDWVILSENGSVLIEEDALYTGSICLPNGCYILEMVDSGNDGWGDAILTITAPDSTVIGDFTLVDGSSGSVEFCVTQYDGPDPEPDDYIQVVSDDVEVVAVSDADAGFTFPLPLCSGDEPFQLTPNTESGSWTVDCDGCFDPLTLTIDPAIAGSGQLEVIHVLDGSCFADVAIINVPISNTPTPVFTATTDMLCLGDDFDFNVSPPYGVWSSSCGACINTTTGYFFSDLADEGVNTVTFTTAGVCPGVHSQEIGVSGPLEGIISGPSILCEDDLAEFISDVPGVWTSDCFGCIDSLTGIFDATGIEPNIWEITFTPESFCPIIAQLSIDVSGSVEIGGSNVPGSFCETADEFLFNINVLGGTWSAPCGTCLDSSGLFIAGGAPIGLLPISYYIENGACSDSAFWEVDIHPVLQGEFNSLPPICEDEQVSLSFTFDDDIPEEYTVGGSGVWSSTDCPGCIINANNGSFGANQLGTVNVMYTFNSACSEPIMGTIQIEPQVSAAISDVPELCATGDVVLLEAEEGGGTWASDCDGCLVNDSFDPSAGAGTYEVTYTIDGVCYDQDLVEVVVVPQRDATITLPDWICLAQEDLQPAMLWPGGDWSGNCDNCIDSSTGLINLMLAGVIELEVTHILEGLCGDSDQVILDIIGCDIEFVNVFTPNGDDQNDELVFEYLQSFPGNRLKIFDRWGLLVYERSNYGNNWRGDGVSDGTYYYELSIPGREPMTGSFMLLR